MPKSNETTISKSKHDNISLWTMFYWSKDLIMREISKSIKLQRNLFQRDKEVNNTLKIQKIPIKPSLTVRSNIKFNNFQIAINFKKLLSSKITDLLSKQFKEKLKAKFNN